MQLVPGDHPARRGYLRDFTNSLTSRVKRLGDLSDIDKAISIYQELIQLTPDGHLDRAIYLINLAQCYQNRFERLGNLSDIEDSILMGENAKQLLSNHDNDQEKARSLECLANSLDYCFGHMDNHVSDINASVMYREEALGLIHDNPNKFIYMDNLGKTLCDRFQSLGNISDINRAVLIGKEAVRIAADDDPRTFICLFNFGVSLMHRFKSLGDLSDVNMSVSILRDAVQHAPVSHPLIPQILTCLGESLRCRFDQFGHTSDIDHAVIVQEEVVQLTPDVNPKLLHYLDDLGGVYLSRFERLGNTSDINRAISVREKVVKCMPDHHPNRVKCINNFANVLYKRFILLKDPHDLDRLILMREQALALCPDTNPLKPLFLDNLGTALLSRFELVHHIQDIDRSIFVTVKAILLISDDHFEKPHLLFNLAKSLIMRFTVKSDRKDLDAAIHHAPSAAHSSSGLPSARFYASNLWAGCVRAVNDTSSSIEAYSIAFSLIPELAWLGSAITDCYHQVMKAGEMVCDAVSATIEIGDYNTAVEWLEQGRSVIWGQLLQLRTPVDDLKEKHSDLATRLLYLSKMLESGGTRGHQVSPNPSRIMESDSLKPLEPSSLEGHHNYHDYATERDNLLKKIRTLEGFDRFLLPKPMTQLLPAANRGPVVLLNTSEYRCDALILIPQLDNVMHISLNGFTASDALALQRSLSNLIQTYGRNIRLKHEADLNSRKAVQIPDDERLANPNAEFACILSQLWIKITKPVLDALKITVWYQVEIMNTD